MNIKNKLILSHVFLILILTSFWIFYSFIDYNTFQQKTKSLADISLREFSDELFKLTKTNIEPFSQKYVELKTKIMTENVEPIIKKYNGNEKKIIKDQKLINIINKLMFVKSDIVIGYSYLINNKNQIILSPNKDAEAITHKPWKNEFPRLYAMMDDARGSGHSKGYYNFYDVNNKGDISIVGEKYGVIMKIPNTDYYIGTTIFLENYKSLNKVQVAKFEKEIMTNIESSFEKHSQTLLINIMLKTISTVIIIIVIFVIIGYWIAKTISDPIQRLTKKVRGINSENLNFSIDKDDYGSFETKELSSAFKFLGDELMDYMENLKREMKERQILDRDLDVAREIQDHALPKVTPGFCKPEFNICGILNPAKKVAGDFYDFYYLSETKIAVVIGDVSGKGISAAYFMAKIKTLMQAFCMEEKDDPAKVLSKINNILSKDNKSYMFATVFLGYYDIKTGDLIYSNAGHHAAVKIKKDKTVLEFGEQKNVVLGFFADSKYENEIEHFSRKDVLILYTDGICEATNSENDMYGKVKFFKSCLKNRNKDIGKMIESIVIETVEFEGDTQQTDDITVLGLTRVI